MVWQGWLGQNIVAQEIQFFVFVALSVHNITLFVYQTKIIFQRTKLRKAPVVPFEWTVIFALFIGSIFAVLSTTRHLIHTTSDASCYTMMTTIIFTLYLTKLMFDLFVLERLLLITESSTLSRIINLAVLFLVLVIATILMFIYNDPYYDDIIQLCQYYIPIHVQIPMFIIESMLVTVLFVTFTRKLNGVDKTNHLLKKCSVLGLVGIVTSQVSYTLSMLVGVPGIIFALDNVINSWCMVLTFHESALFYAKICGPLDDCVGSRCVSCYTCNCCCLIINNHNETDFAGNINETFNTNVSEAVLDTGRVFSTAKTPPIPSAAEITTTESAPPIGTRPRLLKIQSITTSTP
eukprot:53788_1